MANRLAGKSALISGGASGLGEAQAILYAREGAAVLIGDLQAKAAKRPSFISMFPMRVAGTLRLPMRSHASASSRRLSTTPAFSTPAALLTKPGKAGTA